MRAPTPRHARAHGATFSLLAAAALLALAGPAVADGGDEVPGLVSTVNLPAQAQGQPPAWAGRAFRQGVVAVANPYAAEAGARVLEMGGNAVDAAVAIAYALNVVEPQSAGIGGGFMMIHHAASGQTVTIDSRETAPAAATPTMFVGVSAASQQGVAVGVPGMVRGAELALQRYGQLSLAQVLQPAIELADKGFAATPRYVTSPNCAGTNLTSRTKNSPLAAETFCPGGQAIPAGTLVTHKPLAETFKLLAQHGADCFYKVDLAKGCDIALGIVEGQKWNRPQAAGGKGGSMTLADLEAYQPAVRAPVECSYGIGVFAGYTRADGSFRNHGFLLNNELTDFNTAPTSNPWTNQPSANDVQPGKRPRSSMAPTMMFTPDGKPFLAYGSPGGATIINSVVNITLNVVDHGMSLQQAVDAARISVTGAGSTVQIENRFPASTADALRALGYVVGIGDVGSVQAGLVDPHTGKQYGAADNRREGTVIGLPRPQGR